MAITAQAIEDRMRSAVGPGWRDASADGFVVGDPGTPVTGIVTTYAPSLEVLRKAVGSGCNLIVSREFPFWARNNPKGTGRGPVRAGAVGEGDSVLKTKRDMIAANRLVIYHLFENWDARPVDGQLVGLAKVLGWERHYRPSGGGLWANNNGFFVMPRRTLREMAQQIKTTLGMRSIRIAGDPDLHVGKVALSHGLYWLSDLQALLAEPGVDLLVMGEPQWENELAQYSFDLADAGFGKGLILLGQAVSEDPGGGEMAKWLQGFVPEVPVRWIPAGEPCWMTPASRGRAGA